MLDRLKELFRPTKSLPPVLVRVRIPGGLAEGPVDLSARARPSGRLLTARVHASQGLCVVPWMGGSGLDLQLSHASLRGELSLWADDVQHGEVQEIALGPA